VPTYDYKCTKCGHEFAIEQSIHDKPLTRCKKCRGKLEKLLPRTLNLIFKGSGFYVTDYKKSGQVPPGERVGKSTAKTSPKEARKTSATGAAGPRCKDAEG
jgi:putative FmdB family regulatory protein